MPRIRVIASVFVLARLAKYAITLDCLLFKDYAISLAKLCEKVEAVKCEG
jgi:hypothetical protein